ncbi:MAG: hypothetical protein HY084_03300 [Gemmatimonadetes bacterium]|nr:hypothetical protein [Gemmatimonadota bacterium]
MKRLVLALVMLSCLTVGAGYAGAFLPGGAPAWAPWCMAIGTNGALMSLMALGATRRGRLAPALRWTFIGMFVLCAGAFAFALGMPAAEGAGGALLLGLPVRTAVLLYAVGVVPIVILPFAYALTFETSTLSEDDLTQVRAAHQALQRAVVEGRAQGGEA